MTSLIVAAVAFVLLHLLVSGTRVRDLLSARLGSGPYMGLFSLASVAILVWLGFAYGAARRLSDSPVFWDLTSATRHIQIGVQLIAMLLIVPGLLTANPTSVAQEGALDRPDVVRGMLRITRHPFLWGVAVWAAGHLLVNGDAASLILFGAMLVLAVFGTTSIDAKRRRALGDKWAGFVRQTSSLPFAAIFAGRQSLQLGEIGWWKIALGVGVWALLTFAHPWLFGVGALP